ncbi:hypothetical protein C1893_15140 [Pseudomonas sp. MPR-ANC1]|uniref:hypothetical protein n=1 Tax=Pseudomonas sp. MPR-ANC1 TaxID=2075548 RepID=UPI000CD1ADCC|nr:hypothetical protein [Pseudomonas sp. MPR-ANC1]POA47512.1 hypothetical protein C1893_15140 [Pseudomonas sp. MPR-ANC1]
MTNPKASPAVFANGSLMIDVKGTIGGTPVNLASYTTTATSVSFNPLGGYNFSFEENGTLSSKRTVSISLRKLLTPTISGYSESVVTERGIQVYQYDLTSVSAIAVTQLNSNLYRYSLDGFKLSGKALHGEETRELTGSGFFLLQELTWPV